MKTIAIIGAGLSGTLVTINLLLQSKKLSMPLKIYVIDKCGKVGPGLAYATPDPSHLLNVPAGRMSLFPEEPDHFYCWLQEKNIVCEPTDFVSRQSYGQYIEDVYQHTLTSCDHLVEVQTIMDEAVDVFAKETKAGIRLQSGKILYCDKVVLATGNFLSKRLPLKNQAYEKDSRYLQNPWSIPELPVQPNEEVLLIGTGLTMIDMVRTLYSKGHQGKITAISTHGKLPHVHHITAPYPSFLEEIKATSSLSDIVSIVNKHLRKAKLNGIDWRSVVDVLRPDIQKIWLQLSLFDKKMFLRHLAPVWNISRHRMPQCSANILDKMQKNGQLTIYAGKINSIIPEKDHIKTIFYKRLKNADAEILRPKLILNCTGPESNLERCESALLKNMFAGGLLQSDPLNLGANTTKEGALISKSGSILNQIYTIGPIMKGILWECGSVPEIREHAKNLATLLLQPTAKHFSYSK